MLYFIYLFQTIFRQQEIIKDLLEKNIEIPSENILHEDSDSGVVFSEIEFSHQKVNRSILGVINIIEMEKFDIIEKCESDLNFTLRKKERRTDPSDQVKVQENNQNQVKINGKI